MCLYEEKGERSVLTPKWSCTGAPLRTIFLAITVGRKQFGQGLLYVRRTRVCDWWGTRAMSTVVSALLIGFVGGVLLKTTFKAYAHQWPANYADVTDVTDAGSSRSVGVYFMFRIVPVVLASILMLGVASAVGASPLWTLGAFLLVHLVTTTFSPTIWIDIRHQPLHVRSRRILVHLATFALLCVATFAPYIVRQFAPVIVPDPKELKEGFWTAVLVGVVFAIYRKATTFQEEMANAGEPEYLRRVSAKNRKHVRNFAEKYRTSPRFIMSIVGAESINRPKLWRSIERVWGIFHKPGTYGIAQVFAEKPLSDEESIIELCKCHEGFLPSRFEDADKDIILRLQFRQHNRGSRFVEFATTIYNAIARDNLLESSCTDSSNDLAMMSILPVELQDDCIDLQVNLSQEVDHVVMSLAEGGLVRERAKISDTDWLGRSQVNFRIPQPIRMPLTLRAYDCDGLELDELEIAHSSQLLD